MPNLSISEARSKLPELAHRLAASPGSVEYIAHRDLDEDLALTTRSHIRYLETTMEELRKQVAKPFILAGSITSDLSDDELDAALSAGREEQRALAEAKLRELGS
jgi:hypothetical protein